MRARACVCVVVVVVVVVVALLLLSLSVRFYYDCLFASCCYFVLGYILQWRNGTLLSKRVCCHYWRINKVRPSAQYLKIPPASNLQRFLPCGTVGSFWTWAIILQGCEREDKKIYIKKITSLLASLHRSARSQTKLTKNERQTRLWNRGSTLRTPVHTICDQWASYSCIRLFIFMPGCFHGGVLARGPTFERS